MNVYGSARSSTPYYRTPVTPSVASSSSGSLTHSPRPSSIYSLTTPTPTIYAPSNAGSRAPSRNHSPISPGLVPPVIPGTVSSVSSHGSPVLPGAFPGGFAADAEPPVFVSYPVPNQPSSRVSSRSSSHSRAHSSPGLTTPVIPPVAPSVHSISTISPRSTPSPTPRSPGQTPRPHSRSPQNQHADYLSVPRGDLYTRSRLFSPSPGGSPEIFIPPLPGEETPPNEPDPVPVAEATQAAQAQGSQAGVYGGYGYGYGAYSPWSLVPGAYPPTPYSPYHNPYYPPTPYPNMGPYTPYTPHMSFPGAFPRTPTSANAYFSPPSATPYMQPQPEPQPQPQPVPFAASNAHNTPAPPSSANLPSPNTNLPSSHSHLTPNSPWVPVTPLQPTFPFFPDNSFPGAFPGTPATAVYGPATPPVLMHPHLTPGILNWDLLHPPTTARYRTQYGVAKNVDLQEEGLHLMGLGPNVRVKVVKISITSSSHPVLAYWLNIWSTPPSTPLILVHHSLSDILGAIYMYLHLPLTPSETALLLATPTNAQRAEEAKRRRGKDTYFAVAGAVRGEGGYRRLDVLGSERGFGGVWVGNVKCVEPTIGLGISGGSLPGDGEEDEVKVEMELVLGVGPVMKESVA